MPELQENTVHHTLCIPLWGRMLANKAYPDLFPDQDAGRIIRELGVDLSGKKLYKLQYMWMNCLLRQYDMAWEITEYLKAHPRAAVVELGAGLSCLRRQMGNEENPWYCLDFAEVIALRERHIPKGKREQNVVCDLNDLSRFDKIEFKPEDGIVFVGAGLFYYFECEQVQRLFNTMAERFPGGMLAFDAVNAMGLKGVNAEVKLAGNATRSFFSLEKPSQELSAWSENLMNIKEKDYMDGYLAGGWRKTALTRLILWVIRRLHLCFILHVEFRPSYGREKTL